MCRTLPDAFPSKLDAVATRIDISNPLGGQQHGELRTLSPPQQGCQSEIDTLVACLLASSTGQVCISCVLSQDAVLFENSGTANCTDIRTIMCDAWNNLCPCSPCEDLWETYYIDCGYTASCGVMTCDEDCQILLDEADNCMALAPPSCGDCVQGAVAGIPTSALSCLEFEAAICEITKTNCSCSPCEEQLQEYFFSCVFRLSRSRPMPGFAAVRVMKNARLHWSTWRKPWPRWLSALASAGLRLCFVALFDFFWAPQISQ